MNKLIKYAFILLLSNGNVFGQTPQGEIIGNHKLQNYQRTVSNFRHLRIIALDVELQKGGTNSISLTAETNIIDHIISKVENDTLIIQFNKNQILRKITPPKITITFNNLESILGSVSNIKLLSPINSDSLLIKLQTKSSIEGSLNLKYLALHMTTSCKTILDGSSVTVDARLFMNSNLNATNLKVENLTITEETLCTSELNVSKRLTAKLFADSKLKNIGAASPEIDYPSIDQMSSLKSAGRNVDIYKFN